MNEKELPGGKKSGHSKIRTFIALKLPDHVIKKLAGLQKELKGRDLRVKWSRPENIHLTLKFLGDIHPDDAASVCELVSGSAVSFTPISLCARGVGVFPNIRQARVLWTGISGQTDQLAKLQNAIDSGLTSLGFDADQRRFTGHLTLGRFKGRQNTDTLIDMMKTYGEMTTDEFTADTVYVIKSHLKPSGPIYTDLSGIRLGH